MKQFVLDTNILIESPDAIWGFDDNVVCITQKTLEELDGLKKVPGDTGFNARRAIRNINSLKEVNGSYSTGIELNNGGIFLILRKNNIEDERIRNFVNDFDLKKPDNEILYIFMQNMDFNKSILITNDVSMQVKANLLGITTQNYRNVRVNTTNYRGISCFQIENWEPIDELYIPGMVLPTKSIPELEEYQFTENEYVLLTCGNKKAYTIFHEGFLVSVDSKNLKPCGIVPKNSSQKFALNALMASSDEIPLVILKGPAGSAKTFLSLATAVDQVFDNKYGKIVITST